MGQKLSENLTKCPQNHFSKLSYDFLKVGKWLPEITFWSLEKLSLKKIDIDIDIIVLFIIIFGKDFYKLRA